MKQRVTYPTPTMKLLMVLAVSLFSYAFVSGQQKPDIKVDSLETSLNLAEVLLQAEAVSKQARSQTLQAQDTVRIKSFESTANDLTNSVLRIQDDTDFFLKSYLRTWLIQNLITRWIREEQKSLKLNDQISEVIKKADDELRKTQEQQTVWLKRRTEVIQSGVGESLRKPINDLLTDLRNEERALQAGIKQYLSLQEKVSANRLIINTYLDILNPLLNQDFLTFFKRDDSFIWERTAVNDTIPIALQLNRSYRFASQDSWEYVVLNTGKIVFAILLGFVLIFAINSILKAPQETSGATEETPRLNNTESVVRSMTYTFSYVYTITVIFLMAILSKRPPLLSEMLYLLFTFPLIVLVISQAKGIIRFLTIAFLVLYWLYNFIDFLILNNLLTSYIDLGYAVITTLLLYVLFSNRKKFREQYPGIYDYVNRSLIPYLLVLTACAIPLHIIGFNSLGRALTNGSITFVYLAPVILISAIVSRDFFKIFEQTPAIKHSPLAQHYYKVIYTAIKLATTYLLIITFVNGYSLRPLFNSVITSIWTFGGQFGEFNVTVGGVVGFFAILIISVAISGIMKVLLQDEILARINLRRGVAMAIAVIVRYSIVVLGFLLAVASTGFDLNKISILAGALGVGIGFGLQNLVANFISGLILIFERPFVVNDVIETNQIEGNVKEIGIRASKILTYDGAEVIIPNSELISNRLSNWTLTDASRRQIIVVRTSIKADPDEVVSILHRVASQHTNILQTPEPFVLFEGQVDQALQFKIYYWLISEIFKTRSDLNLQIYRELKSLGVELPLQAYEVVLKNNAQEQKSDN